MEATSRFLGSYEKALASFSSFWNVIRLPVTRSVGLKGQGGPGVSETRGGACDVIVRRHEASPRVTERPSATLRLRHPGAPAPDKKDPHQLFFFWFCFSQGCGGRESFCVEAGCGRQRRLLWADPLLCGVVAQIAVQSSRVPAGSRGSPLSCVIWNNGEIGDVTTEGNATWRTQDSAFLLLG